MRSIEIFSSLQDHVPEDYATVQVPAADAQNILTLLMD